MHSHPHKTAKQTAFLVEFRTVDPKEKDVMLIPEVYWAYKIAAHNQCNVFDPIAPGNAAADRQLFLQTKNDDYAQAQRLYVYFKWHASIRTRDKTLREIKNIFNELAAIDSQFAVARDSVSFEYIKSLSKTMTLSESDMYVAYADAFGTLANQIGKNNIINYLSQHPEITTLYGLVGNKHIDLFLNDPNAIVEIKERYSKTQIHVNGRTVIMHLFGGAHSNLDAVRRMAVLLKTEGFLIPPLSAEEYAERVYYYWDREKIFAQEWEMETDEIQLLECALHPLVLHLFADYKEGNLIYKHLRAREFSKSFSLLHMALTREILCSKELSGPEKKAVLSRLNDYENTVNSEHDPREVFSDIVELIKGLMLYPQLKKSHEVARSFVPVTAPKVIDLITEYAGFPTRHQLRFFQSAQNDLRVQNQADSAPNGKMLSFMKITV